MGFRSLCAARSAAVQPRLSGSGQRWARSDVSLWLRRGGESCLWSEEMSAWGAVGMQRSPLRLADWRSAERASVCFSGPATGSSCAAVRSCPGLMKWACSHWLKNWIIHAHFCTTLLTQEGKKMLFLFIYRSNSWEGTSITCQEEFWFISCTEYYLIATFTKHLIHLWTISSLGN